MQLNYIREGVGPPLLLVHPLGGTLAIWRPVLSALTEQRDVIAVDLPGFGASPPLDHGRPPTAAAIADVLVEFCAELEVDRPHVAGISLGGWIALEMAKLGAAASVTAISPAGLWRVPLEPRRGDSHNFGRRLRPLIGLIVHSRFGRRVLLGGRVGRPELLSAADAQVLVEGYLGAVGYRAANREMRAGTFEHEDRIEVPVTIVWGELDRVVGRPSRARRPPGARYLEMPGWGHVPTWDDPDGVARLLLEATSA